MKTKWNFQRWSRKIMWNLQGSWLWPLIFPKGVITKFCGVSKGEKNHKNSRVERGGSKGMSSTLPPAPSFCFFFWYSPFLIFPPSVAYHLASSVMTSQGNLKIRWHCLFWQIHKFSKLGRNKRLIRKKNTLSKKVAPVPTYSGSFEVVLPNKDGSCIVQLFIRSLNSAI